MAEQRTKVGPAYYDGWQKQLADLRAENDRLSAEVERMRGVLGDKPMNIRVLSEAERKQARNESGTVFKMGVYIDDLLSQLAASRAEVARLTAEFKQSDDAQARLYRSENCEER